MTDSVLDETRHVIESTLFFRVKRRFVQPTKLNYDREAKYIGLGLTGFKDLCMHLAENIDLTERRAFQTYVYCYDNVFFRGYAKQHTVENLEPWETYAYRIRFSDGHSEAVSEWSPELTTTTLSK